MKSPQNILKTAVFWPFFHKTCRNVAKVCWNVAKMLRKRAFLSTCIWLKMTKYVKFIFLFNKKWRNFQNLGTKKPVFGVNLNVSFENVIFSFRRGAELLEIYNFSAHTFAEAAIKTTSFTYHWLCFLSIQSG